MNLFGKEVYMRKRIALLMVLTFVCGGTVFSQQQDKTTRRQDQTTKTKPETGTQKDSMPATQQGEMKLAADDKSFVMKAAEAGMAEVEMGQLAVKQASNEEVKRFAQRMVDDHGKANTELTQLAQSKGIMLPASTNSAMNATDSAATPTGQQTSGTTGEQKTGSSPQSDRPASGSANSDSRQAMKGNVDHRKMMDKMAKLSGPEFDREYMRHQVADHDKAVALFEKQAKNGKDSELKAFAERTLPTLKEHQQLARELNSKVGGKMNSSDKGSKQNTPESRPPKQ
jgi:putative membrane protein